jgi:uncharacterized protein
MVDRSQEKMKAPVILRLVVQPGARKTEIVGMHGDPPRLKIRIAAPPVDGKANDELLRFLKTILGCPKRDLELSKGSTSKFKDVLCHNLSMAEIKKKLRLD